VRNEIGRRRTGRVRLRHVQHEQPRLRGGEAKPAQHRPLIVINFEAINYMDSTGLGELIGYLQKFEDRQRKMALVKPSHRILALLKITKLDTIFKIFDSREAAMQYLTDSAA
jgi:anti-anti-sigma factor